MFSCTCSQEKLGFATFRLSNSSLGSKNSSLGPSALGMNFSPLGWITAFRLQKPNSSFLQCTKYYIFQLLKSTATFSCKSENHGIQKTLWYVNHDESCTTKSMTNEKITKPIFFLFRLELVQLYNFVWTYNCWV